MDINDFIKRFAAQFDDTDESEITPERSFKDLDEWSSLVGMSVLNVISKKYGVKLSLADLKKVETVKDLFDLVQSKQ